MTAKLLFSAEDIAARVAELGEEISAAYTGEPLVAVCVLKGAVHFFSDLTRAISREDLEMDFIRISSYGTGTVSSRQIKLTKDLECDVRGKHVLVAEDIIDTGYTMAAGRTLVSCAERDGARYVCVTLCDRDDWRDHAALYDWAFAEYERRCVIDSGVSYRKLKTLIACFFPQKKVFFFSSMSDNRQTDTHTSLKIILQIQRSTTLTQNTGVNNFPRIIDDNLSRLRSLCPVKNIRFMYDVNTFAEIIIYLFYHFQSPSILLYLSCAETNASVFCKNR